MIKLLEKPILPSTNAVDGFSVIKIKANLLSYGCKYSFLTFWCQYINGECTAILCKMEDAFIIAASPEADSKELRDFALTVGFSSIQAHPELLNKMGFAGFEEYAVLFKKGTLSKPWEPADPPSIKRIFEILYSEENKHIRPIDMDGFYADLSHRMRHGTAHAVIYDNAASVLASHITEDAAIISGVATLPNAKGKGYGSKALQLMTEKLSGRNIFVAAEKNVVPFYLKNGFKEYDKIAIYETEE